MVLIVEDHEDSADMLARLLKRSGYASRCVTTAGGALEALADLPVRLAIVDYNLPDHDGIWLLQQMRATGRLTAVPVLFLSGTFEKAVADRALAQGAREWLVKGVDSPARLLESVDQFYRRTEA